MVNNINNRRPKGQQRRRPKNQGMRVQRTHEGPASSRTAMRTGLPTIASVGNGSITVENQEIAFSVNGTATAGVIPAGGSIKVMRFENVGTGNNLNTTNWLTKIAIAYDKFILEDLEMWFIPSVAFTSAGMNAMYFDSDPSRTTPPATVAAVSGDMRATSKQVYAEMRLKVLKNQLNRLPQYETFPASGDTGIATVGSINFVHDSITLANAAAAGTVPIGNVWMRYKVRFLNPSNAVA